uniref:Uncharacterized protein n=1 Tax=Rousettus aegyptiacus TaxID=9407 RepID=A0A7J8C2S9_ROUAE|nr:hypothetical protein HJG63_009437 [Rousettus aegyptiacus]
MTLEAVSKRTWLLGDSQAGPRRSEAPRPDPRSLCSARHSHSGSRFKGCTLGAPGVLGTVWTVDMIEPRYGLSINFEDSGRRRGDLLIFHPRRALKMNPQNIPPPNLAFCACDPPGDTAEKTGKCFVLLRHRCPAGAVGVSGKSCSRSMSPWQRWHGGAPSGPRDCCLGGATCFMPTGNSAHDRSCVAGGAGRSQGGEAPL